MSNRVHSAYERWTWERCRERIFPLRHRLGYGERLWILGFELLQDGRLVDPFHGREVFDPANAGPAEAIPSHYNAVPEMYCLLSTYGTAGEVPLAGEALSLGALDRVLRPELSPDDCAALLNYKTQDFADLQSYPIPFFGATLERGDLAFEVWPLPRIPVVIALWQGDGEVADGGTLLLDVTAAHYLPNLLPELAALAVWRLKNILDPEIGWGYHQLHGKVGVT
jgi:hypothetical protein